MKTDLEIEARLRRTYRTIADHTDTDLELPDESGRAPATLLGDGEASGLRPMRRPRLLLAAALAVLLGIAAALATLAGDQHKEPVRTRLGYDRGAPFLPDAPIKARYGATTVWTGEEMLVLGGYNDDDGDGEFDETAGLGPRPRDVAAYNPATRTWRTIAPLPDKVRGGSLAVWTGRVVVLVYTGQGEMPTPEGTPIGAVYDPAEDEWRLLDDPRLAAAGYLPRDGFMTWTGDRLLFTGLYPMSRDGAVENHPVITLAYDPDRDEWERLPDAPEQLNEQGSVTWTGEELVYVGPDANSGQMGPESLASDRLVAVALDPRAETWRRLPAPPLPTREHAFVGWSGREVLVAGGRDVDGNTARHDAAAFDPSTNTWTRVADAPAELWSGAIGQARGGDVVGSSMVVWGAGSNRLLLFDPTTRAWRFGPALPLPAGNHAGVVSTGTQLIIWGGFHGDTDTASDEGFALTVP